MENENVCDHISEIKTLKTAEELVCEECIKTGDEWVHLRTCQTCGATLCCDESPNKHMTKHYHHSHHPVIISAEPGERWLWCYIDEIFADY
jgi:3-deoxy-D-manno-octulosonate 8-phosphate phosphatase KdsC-like HAD superfamily phosphatase